MTRQTPQIKAHVDRNTGKLIKKKTHLQRLRVKVERVNDRILSVYFRRKNVWCAGSCSRTRSSWVCISGLNTKTAVK